MAVRLTDFSVFYSQDSIAAAEAALADAKKGGSKIVVEKGQIVKVTKDAKGITRREVLTEKWTDWVDYWAVDFDYESKREIIRVPVDLDPEARKQPPGMEKPQTAVAGVGREMDGGLYFRERVAELPHEEGPDAGIDQRGEGDRAGKGWKKEDRGEGGGHLRE